MGILGMLLAFLRGLLCNRTKLAAENLALRQQLNVLHRSVKRVHIRQRDRIFWSLLSRMWNDWRSCLIIVKPETVVRWHRQGFKLYWHWKSRAKRGRPSVDREIRDLIRRLSRENPLWGAPRIQSELRLLGHNVADSTVAKYMTRQPKPSSQTWRTFLANHMKQTAAVDFFTVPTISFKMLFCFVVLSHDRRRILHVNVTNHPTQVWASRQVVEAFPYDEVPRFLLRDNDSIYGEHFRARVKRMGIDAVPIAPGSPWQNPYAERVIGSIRRECLDHIIILNEDHLKRVLDEYVEYYNTTRTHQSLGRNAPEPREVEPPENGRVTSTSYLGGLHHRYTRAA